MLTKKSSFSDRDQRLGLAEPLDSAGDGRSISSSGSDIAEITTNIRNARRRRRRSRRRRRHTAVSAAPPPPHRRRRRTAPAAAAAAAQSGEAAVRAVPCHLTGA